MDLFEKTITEEKIYEGEFIDVFNQKVRLPNGKELTRDIIRHPGGVGILAFTDDNKVILVEQFRKALDRVLLEIPAGKIEKGEDIEFCGRRELEEETGYIAKEFNYLGKIATTPGFTDEYIYLFKAENLSKGNINRDEDEFINVKEIPVKTVKEMIKSGEIIDGKTLAVFMLI